MKLFFILFIILFSTNLYGNNHCIFDKDFRFSWRLLENDVMVLKFENISSQNIYIEKISFHSNPQQKKLYQKNVKLDISPTKSNSLRIKIKDIDKILIGLNKKEIQKKIIHGHTCKLKKNNKSKSLLKKVLGAK